MGKEAKEIAVLKAIPNRGPALAFKLGDVTIGPK